MNRETNHAIAGAGLFALDVVMRLDGTQASPSLGGSAGNVLSILGALGWAAVPVGVVGADTAGETIERDFLLVGADMRWLRRSPWCSTPVIYQHQLGTSSSHDSATHRFTFACPSCGERRRPRWDDEPELSDARTSVPPASVFFLDRPTRLGVTLAQEYAAHGAMVVFEPSAVGDDETLFAAALRLAHVVKYADERFHELSDFALRPDVIEIQTMGAAGLKFRSHALDRDWTHSPAFRVPFVHDTAGAGDWCTAGMLYNLFAAYSQGERTNKAALARSLAFGQVLSTLNCMTEGARGLLSAWSAERIVQAARLVVESCLHETGDTQHTFQSFARDVKKAPREVITGHDVGCCSVS